MGKWKLVDESERVWLNIDDIRKTIGDHCIRLTKLEQNHIYSNRTRRDIIIYLLAGIAIAQFIVGYFQ